MYPRGKRPRPGADAPGDERRARRERAGPRGTPAGPGADRRPQPVAAPAQAAVDPWLESAASGFAEIRRVLKPGGRFYSEEMLRDFIHHPLWSRVLDHPMEDRFDHDDFRDALSGGGFELVATRKLGRNMAFFVADKPD